MLGKINLNRIPSYKLNKTFRILRNIRRGIFRRFNHIMFLMSGVEFGENMRIFNKVYLNVAKDSRVIIGNNFVMTSGEAFNPLCRMQRGMIYVESGAEVIIGNETSMSSPCIWAKNSITIGNHVHVGGDCIILDTDCHNLDYSIRRSHEVMEDGTSVDSATANSAPIIIEDDVMIGTRCIILKGVIIGARSVIAAGSVVTKSIPADCIAAGNPARVIKQGIHRVNV